MLRSPTCIILVEPEPMRTEAPASAPQLMFNINNIFEAISILKKWTQP
jgi:hypothetical protein